MKKIIILTTCLIGMILLLCFFGFHLHIIISNSMEPNIPVGSVIITKDISFKRVKVNDVIVYKRPNDKYDITHRTIKKQSNYLMTKGDANNAADGKIPAADVKEKVMFHIPKLGYVIAYMFFSLKKS